MTRHKIYWEKLVDMKEAFIYPFLSEKYRGDHKQLEINLREMDWVVMTANINNDWYLSKKTLDLNPVVFVPCDKHHLIWFGIHAAHIFGAVMFGGTVEHRPILTPYSVHSWWSSLKVHKRYSQRTLWYQIKLKSRYR